MRFYTQGLKYAFTPLYSRSDTIWRSLNHLCFIIRPNEWIPNTSLAPFPHTHPKFASLRFVSPPLLLLVRVTGCKLMLAYNQWYFHQNLKLNRVGKALWQCANRYSIRPTVVELEYMRLEKMFNFVTSLCMLRIAWNKSQMVDWVEFYTFVIYVPYKIYIVFA